LAEFHAALKNRLVFGIGMTGIVFGLLLAIGYAFSTYWHPQPPYVSYPADRGVGAIYLLSFLVIVTLLLIGKHRWLILLGAFLAAVTLLYPLRVGDLLKVYLLLAWFLWVSWVIGDSLIRLLKITADLAPGERLIFGLVLGWGVLVVLVLFLGLIAMYRGWVFHALLGLISLWGLGRNWTRMRKLRLGPLPDTWLDSLTITLVVIIALGSFLWALAPAVRYDSLSYHLAVPERFIRAGGMIELPESFQTYWAHYGEMLYVLALLIGEQPLPGLINFSAGLVLALQTFFLAECLVNRTTGLIAVLVLYSLPIIGIESATTYIDIFIAVFVSAALHSALIWERDNRSVWLLLMGIFSGLAVGTKLTAFWLLIPFWGLILWRLYQRRKLSWINMAVIVAPIILLWSPWLVRDWLWTGNPLFPNLNSVFQSPEWFDRNFFIFQPTRNTLRSILLFPWWGITQSHAYYHEAPGAVLAGLPLLSLPWLYHQRKKYVVLFFTASTAMALLFGFGANARYLMPLFPLFSILAALNIAMLGEKLYTWKKWSAVGFVLFCLVYVFSTRLAFNMRWWEIPERYPIRIWSSRESPEEFVDRILPVYGAFEYLDQQGNFKVLSVGNELRLYTDSDIYGVFFSKEAYQALHSNATEEGLIYFLTEKGYDYILVYPPELQHRPEVYQSSVLSEDFFSRYTRLEYQHKEVYLYRLNRPDP
jgi:hypothetical protein